MTTATGTPVRRTLRFETLDDALKDAEAVLAGDYVTVGNWSAGQILEHLAMAMHASIDGFPFKAPLYMRLIAPFIKNGVLINAMKPGIQLPKSAARYVPSPDVPVDQALEHFRSGIQRLAVEDPQAPHPFFGRMAREEFIMLHLRHAELHLSYIVPT